ncbi:EamA domain [Dillenia turbinata]|uniref:WAT1-related protein n=1 Tax=Dillenia turbinata TaxID=194707 RepID=A0AAN8VTQ5_9MAGN
MKAWRAYVGMVLIQIAYGGSNILIKIALDRGLNQVVFVVYRHMIAMVLLAPFAYVFESMRSRKKRPSLSFSVTLKIFALALLGTTVHLNVYYAGLVQTSPTVASALSNIIPSLTFLVAVLLGMEKVKLGSARGRAKVMGTLICISGSLVFTLWKGGCLFKGFVNRPMINIYDDRGSIVGLRHNKANWIKGSALILLSYIAWSGWLILQAIVYKVYPAPLSLNALICFFASLQSSLLAPLFGRSPSVWKLKWNVELFTIIYCGVAISALVYYLQTWCISNKGPVFAAMFSPLLLVTVGLFSAIAFAEQLHLGSLIGSILIIVGLYFVLWGKLGDIREEEPRVNGVEQSKPTEVSEDK